jgi:hypothetical protein
MAYCEHCGAFIEDFQDSCGQCSRTAGRSPERVESPPVDPLLTWWPEESPRYSTQNGRRLKDSDMALLLSFFLPGSGQAYDGRKERGGLVLLTFLALLVASLAAFSYRSIIGVELSIVLIAVVSVFWLAQVIDAARVTSDTNQSISGIPEN